MEEVSSRALLGADQDDAVSGAEGFMLAGGTSTGMADSIAPFAAGRWSRRGIPGCAGPIGGIAVGLAVFVVAPVIAAGIATGFYSPARVVRLPPVRRGAKLVTRATIVNATPIRRAVQEVLSSCGCTSTVVGSRDVRPFGATTLEMTIDTTKLQGEYSREISVESSPMTAQPLIIELRGSTYE